MINDIQTELPLAVLNQPANFNETRIAQALLNEAKETYNIPISLIVGNTNFDIESFLNFIVYDLLSSPVIPHNPRRESGDYSIRVTDIICQAGLEMYRKG
ncbi:MAG: hypothetical protein ACFFDY_14400 [Candidatus Thorarchaeota archaeon]